ncbi:Ionotropic receptor 411 [Blattella germanica]|nr:Ionotropic receptor 411 [Blattella germanica]
MKENNGNICTIIKREVECFILFSYRNLRPFLSTLFAICGGYGMLLPPDLDTTEERLLGWCILHIVETHFSKDLPLAIETPSMWYPAWNSSHGDTLLEMLFTHAGITHFTLGYIQNTDLPRNTPNKFIPGSFIILIPILRSQNEVENMLTLFKRILVDSRNPRAKLIIIFMQTEREFTNQIVRTLLIVGLFSNFSRLIVLTQIVDSHQNKIKRMPSFDVFGFNPNEQKDICSMNIDKISYIDTWSSVENRFLLNATMFQLPGKLNLNQCGIQVAPHTYPPFVYVLDGIKEVAAKCVSLFCERFNCRIELNYSHFHIEFPVKYETEYLYDIDGASYPHFTDELKWFVPAGEEIPRWQSFFRVFTPQMWVFACGTSACGTFTLWLIQKYKRQFSGEGPGHTVLITSLLTHLGFGDSNHFSGYGPSTFFAIWLFYCLIINTAYQSALLSFLVSPGQYPGIETEEQLLASGLNMKRLFVIKRVNDSVILSNINKYELCEKLSLYCFTDMALHRDFAVLYGARIGGMISGWMKEKYRREVIVQLKQTFWDLHLAFHIPRLSSILFAEFEPLVHRVVSVGLIEKWTRDEVILWNDLYKILRLEPVFAFSLWHLQGGFFFLLFGNLLALVVFVVELYVK